MDDKLRDDLETWKRKSYEPFREKGGERRPAFTTTSGIEIGPLYTPLDHPEERVLEDVIV